MSASEPEADTEYSRHLRPGTGPRRRVRRRSGGADGPAAGRVRAAPAAAAVAGAALLVAAELSPLLYVHSGAYGAGVIRTLTAGSHHSYALAPVAALALALAFVLARRPAGTAAGRPGLRTLPALAGLAALGAVALGIALVGDLPAAHASGLLTAPNGRLVNASSSAGIALYLEVAGALALLLGAAAGLVLWPRPGQERSAC